MSGRCKVDGCERRATGRGYCHAHYMRWFYTGTASDEVPLRTYGSSPITVSGETAVIELSNGDTATINAADVELVDDIRWHRNGRGYVFGRRDRQVLILHRLITDCPRGLYVDHVNGNPLDNRRDNLRVASNAQNQANRTRVNRNNKSGHPGVSWDSARGKWTARIQVNGRGIQIGRFDDLGEAVEARQSAARAHFGEFASRLEVG